MNSSGELVRQNLEQNQFPDVDINGAVSTKAQLPTQMHRQAWGIRQGGKAEAPPGATCLKASELCPRSSESMLPLGRVAKLQGTVAFGRVFADSWDVHRRQPEQEQESTRSRGDCRAKPGRRTARGG